jgi:outer membrane protein assembly factor BamB
MKAIPCLLLLSTVSLNAADWSNWRGPDYDGTSKEIFPANLPETLPIAWKTNVGTGFSSVSVAGDRVLTKGNENEKDTVWCLSTETGEVIWKHTYDCALDPLYYEGGPGGTPTIHEDSVYTLSKKGHAFRLDLETGKVIWKRDLIADHGFELPEWSFAGSAFIDRERVLLNVGRGGLALSKETGETLWMPSTETSGYATVVPFSPPGGDPYHLLFSAKSLIGFDSATGKQRWEYPWKSSRDVNAADPLIVGNRILVSSSGGTELLSFEEGKTDPVPVWKQHDMKWYFNPGVLIGDHLYSLHGTTHRPTELICTEVDTGKIVWQQEGFGSGGLKAAGDTVIVFDNGLLTLFRATPGKYDLIHQQKILDGKCWTAPVFSHGKIYCRNAAGELAAVNVNP